MACIIRQESLSGIQSFERFEQTRLRLALIPNFPLTQDTFILAAEFFNTCRDHGIAAGTIDMTICAAAYTHNVPIFTIDPNFKRYAHYLPIQLYNL